MNTNEVWRVSAFYNRRDLHCSMSSVTQSFILPLCLSVMACSLVKLGDLSAARAVFNSENRDEQMYCPPRPQEHAM